MKWWQVYLIMQLDSFRCLLIAGIVILSFTVATILGIWGIWHDPSIRSDPKTILPLLKSKLIWSMLAIFIFLATVTPDTKSAAIIYLMPKIANNEDISSLPSDLAKMAREMINRKVLEWTEEKAERKK